MFFEVTVRILYRYYITGLKHPNCTGLAQLTTENPFTFTIINQIDLDARTLCMGWNKRHWILDYKKVYFSAKNYRKWPTFAK